MFIQKTLIFLSLHLIISSSSFAHNNPKINIKELLGPYPAIGSVEDAHDFKQLLDFQRTRTQEQCQQAAIEEMISLPILFAGANGPLNKFETWQFTPLFLMMQLKTMIYSRTAKTIFKRPRPYVTNPKIEPCIKREKSYAYPSGHTIVARYSARVFAAIFPNRAKAFMQRADEFAKNRVLGGVHHPTDIIAGKKLGDALADQFIKYPIGLGLDP